MKTRIYYQIEVGTSGCTIAAEGYSKFFKLLKAGKRYGLKAALEHVKEIRRRSRHNTAYRNCTFNIVRVTETSKVVRSCKP